MKSVDKLTVIRIQDVMCIPLCSQQDPFPIVCEFQFRPFGHRGGVGEGLEIFVVFDSEGCKGAAVKVAGVKEVDTGVAVGGYGKDDAHGVKGDEVGGGEVDGALDAL